MFGPRLSTVFANRWRAALWAASVLLTAYCSIPSPDEQSPLAGELGPIAADSGSIEEDALGQSAFGQSTGAPKAHKHYNPWALKKGADKPKR